MKKAQVYIVTKGSYSDYRILAAFADKKAAKAFAAKATEEYSEAQVETYDLRSGMPEKAICYTVEVDDDGKVLRQWSHEQRDFEREKETAHFYKHHRGGRSWATSDRGYDEALKAARDNMAAHKAKKAGL